VASFGNYVIPLVIVIIIIAGLIRRENVFDLFMSGAKDGITVAISVLPALIALMTAIAMFHASGAFELLTKAIEPLCRTLNLPQEISGELWQLCNTARYRYNHNCWAIST